MKTYHRCVEWELYNHASNLLKIKKIKEDIMLSTPILQERVQTSNIMDTTAHTAMKLVSHKQLKYLEEITSVIEDTYSKLDDAKKRMVEMKYWKNEDWDAIADEMHVTSRTIYYWRVEILNAICEKMGWGE